MLKRDKNIIISEMISSKIREKGLDKELGFEAIENTRTPRPTYFHDKNGTRIFSVFMWQLNSLEGEELEKEIEYRIETARLHFGL